MAGAAPTCLRILAVSEGIVRPDHEKLGIRSMLDAICSVEVGDVSFCVHDVHLFADASWQDLTGAIKSDIYDQIWFFGSSSKTEPDNGTPRPLRKDELAELGEFMRRRGGVFATGDHAGVGAPLCAEIPRVRYMRSWGLSQPIFAGLTPPKYELTRAETVVQHGLTGVVYGEEDAIGKSVWVKSSEFGRHPLFVRRTDDGVIGVLPDHMHEGQCCVVPSAPANPTKEDLDELARIKDEFPGNTRPEIIAWSVKRGFSGEFEDMPSIHPVVCCYDGWREKLGRVVVDSTFHHWTWGNIENLSEPARKNMYVYAKNVARWLSRHFNTEAGEKELLTVLVIDEEIQHALRRGYPENENYCAELGRTAEKRWRRLGFEVAMLRGILDRHVPGSIAPVDGARPWDKDGEFAKRRLDAVGRVGLLLYRFAYEHRYL